MEQLRPTTLGTLRDLSNFSWFSRVGKRHQEVSTADILSNWYEAVASAEDSGWEDLCLDAVNGYCERLAQVAPSRYRTWNVMANAIKAISAPIIASVFAGRPSLQELPKLVQETVQWDVLHVCLEAEFSDCIPPGFYASNAYWYRVGHFPCGWRGKFPDGTIVIY